CPARPVQLRAVLVQWRARGEPDVAGARAALRIETNQDRLACCSCVERELEEDSAITVGPPRDVRIQPADRALEEEALTPLALETMRTSSTHGAHRPLETHSPARRFHPW